MATFGVSGALLPSLFDQGGMAGVLSEGYGAARQDAEDQGGHRGECETDGSGNADGTKLIETVALSTGPGVDGGQQAQVVKAGDAAVEQADDRQPDVAAVNGGGEDIELAE